MSVITRKIDELGRIVLPIEFRKALNVDTKCDLDMEVKDGAIVLIPKQTVCHRCVAVIPDKSKYCLCKECIKVIKEDESIG